jgi:hypothetical protein
VGLAFVPLACTAFDGLSARRAPATSKGDDAGATLDQGTGPEQAAREAGAPEAGGALVTYLAEDDAARACARTLECPNLAASITYSISVPLDAANYSACMTWLAGAIPPSHEGIGAQRDLLSCVARATTCAEASACLIFELIAPDDARCANRQGTSRCLDSQTVLDCDDYVLWRCGVGHYAPGSSCAVPTQGVATCAVAEASGTCTAPAECTGTYADHCDGTMRFRWDCATLGLSCALGEDGGVDCDGTDPACQNLGASCDGDRVRACNPPYVSVYDCAALGGTCSSSGSVVRCVHSDDACGPGDPDVNICNGTKLAACVGGERRTIDCASLGMKCVNGAPPTTAHCG